MQVDLHSSFFYNIHHIQRHNHWFSQLQKLQSQIKVPLQSRSVHHIDDHIHLISQDILAAHLLLHGVGGQAVGSRKVHQLELMVVVFHRPFHLFHRHSRPVGYLELCSGERIEQGRLSTVGISDKSNSQIFLHTLSLTVIFLEIAFPTANLVPRTLMISVPWFFAFSTETLVPLVIPNASSLFSSFRGRCRDSTMYLPLMTP